MYLQAGHIKSASNKYYKEDKSEYLQDMKNKIVIFWNERYHFLSKIQLFLSKNYNHICA